jgi:cation diffusion facilitator family transporter
MSPPCDDCNEVKDLSGASKGYRRAVVLVVVLNLGMGVTEMIGGLVGGSQALKADSLDFLGDGFITLLGLVAISRGRRWRAQAALLQGYFLGILALGVVGAAIYRAFEREAPEPIVMGTLGGIALGVNVVAALLLVPYRHGDASVRAVWLFSRNDALGNLAVVLAAGLVAWTGTPWPDIIAALIIAALFFSSALQIVRIARREFTD